MCALKRNKSYLLVLLVVFIIGFVALPAVVVGDDFDIVAVDDEYEDFEDFDDYDDYDELDDYDEVDDYDELGEYDEFDEYDDEDSDLIEITPEILVELTGRLQGFYAGKQYNKVVDELAKYDGPERQAELGRILLWSYIKLGNWNRVNAIAGGYERASGHDPMLVSYARGAYYMNIKKPRYSRALPLLKKAKASKNKELKKAAGDAYLSCMLKAYWYVGVISLLGLIPLFGFVKRFIGKRKGKKVELDLDGRFGGPDGASDGPSDESPSAVSPLDERISDESSSEKSADLEKSLEDGFASVAIETGEEVHKGFEAEEKVVEEVSVEAPVEAPVVIEEPKETIEEPLPFVEKEDIGPVSNLGSQVDEASDHEVGIDYTDSDTAFAMLASGPAIVSESPTLSEPAEPEVPEVVSEPVVVSDPAPVVVSEPEPVVVHEPEPTIVSEPEPVAATESESVAVSETQTPEPVTTSEASLKVGEEYVNPILAAKKMAEKMRAQKAQIEQPEHKSLISKSTQDDQLREQVASIVRVQKHTEIDPEIENIWQRLSTKALEGKIDPQTRSDEAVEEFFKNKGLEIDTSDLTLDLSEESMREDYIGKLKMLAITDSELRELLSFKNLNHLPAIIEYIMTKPEPARLALVARELGYYPDAAVIDTLSDLIYHKDHRVALAAIQGLENSNRDAAIPLLCPFIRSEVPVLAQAARSALTKFGPTRIIEVLQDLPKERDEKVREAGVFLLSRMNGAAVEALLKQMLKDTSESVRCQAILAMSYQKNPVYIAELREFFKTTTGSDRILARKAIVYLQGFTENT